jgi:transcriptional regulator of acetoin/glycerol metabolism
VLERLVAHDWPGNLREMANTLNATAALAGAGNAVTLDDLPNHIQTRGPVAVAMLPDGPLGSVTEAMMQRALEQHRGNFSAAARALGIDRSTLYRRLVWRRGDDAARP